MDMDMDMDITPPSIQVRTLFHMLIPAVSPLIAA